MNRANSWASFDIVHVWLDAFILFVSFFLLYPFFGHETFTANGWRAFFSIYLVGIFLFLLANRTLRIYDNTVFFYNDRIIRRVTFSFIIAVLCGTLLFCNVSDFTYVPNFIWWLLGVSYIDLLLEILLDIFIMKIIKFLEE